MDNTMDHTPAIVISESAPGSEELTAGSSVAEGSGSSQNEAERRSRTVQKRIAELVKQREMERRRVEQLELTLQTMFAQIQAQGRQAPGPVQGNPASAPYQGNPAAGQYRGEEEEDGGPSPEQFDDYTAFVKARARYEAQRAILSLYQAHAMDVQKQQANAAYQQRAEMFRQMVPDFDDVAHGPHFPITPEMRNHLQESSQGPAIAYYLGNHPEVAEEMVQMAPRALARAMGILEAQISNGSIQLPTPARLTQAPEPITPVGGREAASKDPRKMSTEEYAQWRNAQLRQRKRSL